MVYIPTSLNFDEIYKDISFLSELTGTEGEGKTIIADMKARLDAVTSIVSSAEPKTVYFEISPAPYLFTVGAGTFLDDAITLAGGINVYGD